MNGYFAFLSQHPGFPGNKKKQRSCPASFWEALHLIKVIAEFFCPDKTLSKPKMTGQEGSKSGSEPDLSGDGRDCLKKAVSNLRKTLPLQSDGYFLSSGYPDLTLYYCYRHTKCKRLYLMSSKNLANPKARWPHIKLPEHKVSSPQSHSLQHFNPWLHSVFCSLIVLCVPSYLPQHIP